MPLSDELKKKLQERGLYIKRERANEGVSGSEGDSKVEMPFDDKDLSSLTERALSRRFGIQKQETELTEDIRKRVKDSVYNATETRNIIRGLF